MSTDYVFDGTKVGPYVEWDRTNPQSAYGRSKEAGEQEAGPLDLVVRTSWVCGFHGANLVKTVLKLAAEPDRQLAFVSDQVGCPTMAGDLAATLVSLVADEHHGTFHATNGGAVSWYEFVGEILRYAGHDPARVRPITTDELDPAPPGPAPAQLRARRRRPPPVRPAPAPPPRRGPRGAGGRPARHLTSIRSPCYH